MATCAVSACSCNPDVDGAAATELARAAAASLQYALDVELELRDPYRCARIGLPEAQSLGRANGRQLRIDGNVATLEEKPGDRTLVVAFVADARAPVNDQDALLRRFADAFREAKVEFVVSLGGIAEDETDLRAIYSALSDPTWVLVALAGDRERIPALRSAVAAVHRPDAPVIDATRISFVAGDGVTIGSFPGVARAEQLAGGREGCLHTEDDASIFAEALAEKNGNKIWASYAPPRQAEDDGSDVAIGGIHVGERELTAALIQSQASLVVHGLLDEASAGPQTGSAPVRKGKQLYLGAGSLDPLPVRTLTGDTERSAALIVTMSNEVIRWRRVTGE